MKHVSIFAFVLLALLSAGCGPQDARAGFLLSGVETPMPADWRFTDKIQQIAIQVHTPYLVPHAVTIWCAQVDGELYVGANAPQTKHWPGWVDRNPDVRLRIGEQIFAARLVPLDDASIIAQVQAAYAAKYKLNADAGNAMGEVRYWHVTARTTPTA